MFSIASSPNRGLPAKVAAGEPAMKMKAKPRYSRQEDDCIDFDAGMDGDRLSIVAAGKPGGDMQVVTQKGESGAMAQIAGSAAF